MKSLGLYCFAAAFAGIVLISQGVTGQVLHPFVTQDSAAEILMPDDAFDHKGMFHNSPADDGFRDATRSVERIDHNGNRPNFLRDRPEIDCKRDADFGPEPIRELGSSE